ncbi:hypothetical protein KCP77_17540 [Salmonella enterica subsp. enterica]|nr:hypothetical protein KCP77_17540 [Salmonella enterica subsp. enterica]
MPSSSSGALITVVREGASIIGLFIMMFLASWQPSSSGCFWRRLSIAIRVVSKRFRSISKICRTRWDEVTTPALNKC